MRRIQIYDTTLRDGAQAEGISFSLQDKLQLTQRLDQVGIDFLEGGYPASNAKDFQFFRQVRDFDLKHLRVCAFGMTRRKATKVEEDLGLQALLDSEAEIITLVGKASAFHVSEILRTDRAENLAMIEQSIRFLVEAGREVIFDAEHFFDGWKHDSDYALEVIERAAESGSHIVVLCDTNGGSMPEEIAEIITTAIDRLSVPVGIHCHNDCDLATANTLAAIDAGATQVQGTMNGFGERCGNADLISIIANLAVKKKGYEVLRPEGLEHLTELSRYVYEMANMNFRARQSFVGKSAFAHKGGMHVSAVNRNTASYEHIDPQVVGNERRVLVSELSGRSNIATALADKARQLVSHANGDSAVAIDNGLIDKILAQVVSMENDGYQFEAADGSFELLVRRCMGTYQPHFDRISYRVNIETTPSGAILTEATVKIRVGESIRHEVAEGDGPVNALDAAMRKALINGAFCSLKNMHLVDYKVRVINSEAATAAGVRVVIESQDEHDTWGTVGVSDNIIEASWIALADSIEYKLHKDESQDMD